MKKIILTIIATLCVVAAAGFAIFAIMAPSKEVYTKQNAENEMYLREALGATNKSYLIDNNRPLLISYLGAKKLGELEFNNNKTFNDVVGELKKAAQKGWTVYYNQRTIDQDHKDKLFTIKVAKNYREIAKKVNDSAWGFLSSQAYAQKFAFTNNSCNVTLAYHYYEYSAEEKANQLNNCLKSEIPSHVDSIKGLFNAVNADNRKKVDEVKSKINLDSTSDFETIKVNVKYKEINEKDYGIFRYFTYITGSGSDYVVLDNNNQMDFFNKFKKEINTMKPSDQDKIKKLLLK